MIFRMNRFHRRIGEGTPATALTKAGDTLGAFYTPTAWKGRAKAGKITLYFHELDKAKEFELTPDEARELADVLDALCDIHDVEGA